MNVMMDALFRMEGRRILEESVVGDSLEKTKWWQQQEKRRRRKILVVVWSKDIFSFVKSLLQVVDDNGWACDRSVCWHLKGVCVCVENLCKKSESDSWDEEEQNSTCGHWLELVQVPLQADLSVKNMPKSYWNWLWIVFRGSSIKEMSLKRSLLYSHLSCISVVRGWCNCENHLLSYSIPTILLTIHKRQINQWNFPLIEKLNWRHWAWCSSETAVVISKNIFIMKIKNG